MTVEVHFLVRPHMASKGEFSRVATATAYTYLFHDAEDRDRFKAILDAIQDKPE
jgi:hypothetical protein